MKKIEIKSRVLLIVIVTGINLAGCHKNPLLNTDMINGMKENFLFRDATFPIGECTDYYSGFTRGVALKKKCTQWTQEYYHQLINSHSIPTETTLEDFRDAVFWKKVKAAKVW